ncbi:hypothetical protein KSP40_PGU020165 [Platanthera guangdongensis]|uniref:Uncharacterized protein n=1 Tax=Platanthera guangdongensis TaxID=2320717 RepID=A0ABR2N3Q1_9ASPA
MILAHSSQYFFSESDGEDESGLCLAGGGGEPALPDRKRVGGGGGAGSCRETGHGEGCVEVLANLSDYPIGDGPGVDPEEGGGEVGALGDDGWAEGLDGVCEEVEVIVRGAGEEASHVLVGAGAVEPPFKVGARRDSTRSESRSSKASYS